MMMMKYVAVVLSICCIGGVASEKGLCATPCELPEVCEPCGGLHCCKYPEGVRHWGKWCCYRYCQYGEVCATEACHSGSTCKWPWLVEPGEKFEADSSAAAAVKEYLKYLEGGGDPSGEAFLASLAGNSSAADGGKDHHHHHHHEEEEHGEGHGEAEENHGSGDHGHHAHETGNSLEGTQDKADISDGLTDQYDETDGHPENHHAHPDHVSHPPAENSLQEIDNPASNSKQALSGAPHGNEVVSTPPPRDQTQNQSLQSSPIGGTAENTRRRYPWSSYTIITTYDEDGRVIREEVVPPEGVKVTSEMTSRPRGRSYQRIQRPRRA